MKNEQIKTLKFQHHLAENILAGRKTATWRLFDDKDLQVGDSIALLYFETKEKFADAKIIDVREKKLGSIEEKDFRGYEKFNSQEEMLEIYREYYGDRVNWDTPVKIIEFELINNIDSQNLFQKVKDLKLPAGQYVLFGSAPLGIRNIRECHDIDIVVTESLWNEFERRRDWEIKIGPSGDKYFEKDKIELWKAWGPENWDIEKLIKEAEIIDGLFFVKLESVLEWKKLCGREKDLKDIELIENFLRAGK